ncbi:hypothetical protein CKO42_23135 [Lamprobacter modestohalophilus]|uniref:Uncharacterized protein n=2 Tax=Lamprobacter modestohalophilus TaxID=1064514 RepID=A0A9X0WDZ1_9GAMM|nr:hypothetical protein [Lamprobacter modestohalophilus]
MKDASIEGIAHPETSSLTLTTMSTDHLGGYGFCFTLQYINSQRPTNHTMASAKTTTITFRIELEFKEALRTAAHRGWCAPRSFRNTWR